MSRRGYTLAECFVAISLVGVLVGVVLPVGWSMARDHRDGATAVGDLATAARLADRLAREVRASAAARGPNKATGEVLVLTGRDGVARALRLEHGAEPGASRVVLGGEDLGRAARIDVRLEPAQGPARLVSLDVWLPPVVPGARPACLSTCARVGAGEAP